MNGASIEYKNNPSRCGFIDKIRSNKRDSSVELLRIFACIIVIFTHTKPHFLNADYTIRADALAVAIFVADAVSIFLMVTGFYLTSGVKKYIDHLKTLLFKTVIPSLCFVIFAIIFNNIVNGVSINDSMNVLFKDLFNLTNFLSDCYHLWYIYVFVFISLIQPLLRSIAELLERRNGWIFFIVLGLFMFLWNDLTSNTLMNFSHHTINAFVPACYLVLLGNYLYKRLDYVKKKKYLSIVFLLVFVISNILRAKIITLKYTETGLTDLIYWHTLAGIISAVSFSLFVLVAFSSIKRNSLINFIGSLSFNIYLIHTIVLSAMRHFGFMADMEALVTSKTSIPLTFAYTLGKGAVVFLISVLICAIIEILKFYCKRLVKEDERKVQI